MIYGFYTKALDKIEEIISYVKETYGEDIIECTDIDWGTGSNQSEFYTFFDITSENFDIKLLDRTLKVFSVKLENGNTFYKVITYVPTINDYIPILEKLLEQKAKEYFFDSSVDACSYTGSDNLEFRKESLAFVAWRDQLWGPVFEQLKVDLASGPVDFEQFLANLPTYESYLN